MAQNIGKTSFSSDSGEEELLDLIRYKIIELGPSTKINTRFIIYLKVKIHLIMQLLVILRQQYKNIKRFTMI